ncbi:helix-turn-helix domain-containing protein [Tenacibaculum sp. C7A-26P2]|uniref:helix-turn-helix domain-containing protein n=1 Tax=Tenacibaculum sp. C7A-26P2 TaxID=3447504 RepID=UPI003F854B49
MALQNIKTYQFRNVFSLQQIAFDKACSISKEERVNSYKIIWVKEGSGVYSIDFDRFIAESDTLFFLSPGQVFSVDSEKIKNAYQISFTQDFYCLQAHDSEVACNGVLFNNVYKTPSVSIDQKDRRKLDFIVENLIEEFEQSETAKYDMLQSYLKQFIVHSVRMISSSVSLKDDIETRLYKDFSVLVEQNFKSIHSVTEYANRLGLSPKSLSKHFQKIGTETPSDLIKSRIITEAKRQLLYSSKTIKHIAFDLGFNDPAYFSRFFTKATGKSPKLFQKTT